VTDLSILVKQEQSSTENVLRSLSSLHDRCDENVTRSEHQSDLRVIENRLRHSQEESETVTTNTIDVTSLHSFL
jgi:hypothetical protein